MVIAYSDGGMSYLEAPYSDEEVAYMRKHTSGPPIAMYGSRPDRASASQPGPAKAKARQAKPRRAPKRPSELPEELANRIGLDPILQWMHRNGRPLTAESYLNLQGVPEEQLGYDEQRTLDLLRQLHQ